MNLVCGQVARQSRNELTRHQKFLCLDSTIVSVDSNSALIFARLLTLGF